MAWLIPSVCGLAGNCLAVPPQGGERAGAQGVCGRLVGRRDRELLAARGGPEGPPAGTAYAVWTNIGAVGGAATGIAWFGEPATVLRLFCMALVVAGIMGSKR